MSVAPPQRRPCRYRGTHSQGGCDAGDRRERALSSGLSSTKGLSALFANAVDEENLGMAVVAAEGFWAEERQCQVGA